MLRRASPGDVFQEKFAIIYTDVQLSPCDSPSGKVREGGESTGFKSEPSQLSRHRDQEGDGNARNMEISHL